MDDGMKDSAARTSLLLETSLQVGAHWARTIYDELMIAGRAIEGGWPGTVREAKTRVAAHFRYELPRHKMLPLRDDELVAASRFAYEKAKRDWSRFTREG